MRVVVSTDAHSIRALNYAALGIDQAIAWLTKEQSSTRALVEGQDEEMTFREDGHRAVDWAADYLERVGDLPVLARCGRGISRRGFRRRHPSGLSRSRRLCDLDESSS